MSDTSNFHVGICGAGLGGLAAAIAIRRAGAKVTVLEAAHELGEVGAGIQMTPNVSRLLIRWGVADIIGDNLVECDALRTFDAEGQLFQRNDLARTRRDYGFPWWAVHRADLHSGLVQAATTLGADIIVNSRVAKVQDDKHKAHVTTTQGASFAFDLLLGADGIKSTIRRHLFPNATPHASTGNAAYRATIPYEHVFRAVPEARHVLSNTIDTYMHPNSYAIFYPVRNGTELNLVLSHTTAHKVTAVEPVDMAEVRAQYATYPPTIRAVIDLVTHTQHWPLLHLSLPTWRNALNNIALLGDAAHPMENHLGQGAASAIEDAAFLGRALQAVLARHVTLAAALQLYETHRRPRAALKMQASYLTGRMLLLSDAEHIRARDAAFHERVGPPDSIPAHPHALSPGRWSWDLFTNPDAIPSIAGYDAEADADFAVQASLLETGVPDPQTDVVVALERFWMGPFVGGRVGELAGLRM